MKAQCNPEELKHLQRLCRKVSSQTRKMIPKLKKRHGPDAWYDPYSLECLCAISAGLLYTAMKHDYPDVRLAVCTSDLEGHSFVVYKGLRLDPTAMQFGAPGPLVEPHITRGAPSHYQRAKQFSCLEAFNAHLKKRGWPAEQRPDFLVESLNA